MVSYFENKSIMKNKFLFCLIGFILLSVPLETIAQENSKYYAIAGIQHMKFKNLNEKLKSNNLPETNSRHYYLGLGGNTDFGKIILGGEGYLHHSSSSNLNPHLDILLVLNESNGGMGYLYAGYKVLNSPRFYFYPRVGLGAGGVNVKIKPESSLPLDSFLSKPRTYELSTGNFIFHSGLKFGFELSEDFDFNFDVGYNLGLNKNKWNSGVGRVTESVADPIGGAFAQIAMVFAIY